MSKTIVIFGGSGFIGNYIIRRLCKIGLKIIVPLTNIEKSTKLKIHGQVGQIIPIKLNFIDKRLLSKIINESDCIINLKTSWFENKYSNFNNEIFLFNKFVIDSIKNKSSIKYIFFSGIGVDKNKNSKRTRIIKNVEEYIIDNLNNYNIIRPSIVIGNGDKFLNKVFPMIKFFFTMPVFGGGNQKIQPVYVDDIAHAVEKLVLKKNKSEDIYELGGSEVFTYKGIYQYIASLINKKNIYIYSFSYFKIPSLFY